MKLSKHSKERMKERAGIKNEKIQKNFFKNALKYGKSMYEISTKKEKLINFIKIRTKYNCKIKIYKDYVFIYSKNSHRLYTMYKLPEELTKD